MGIMDNIPGGDKIKDLADKIPDLPGDLDDKAKAALGLDGDDAAEGGEEAAEGAADAAEGAEDAAGGLMDKAKDALD